MAETSGTTNSMEVSFAVLGKIKVDNHVDGLNVDSSGE